MVLSKSFRVYHKLDTNGVYSILLDQKTYKCESLLFEAEAVATISPSEADSVRHLYSTVLDAYGCLGVLQLSIGDTNILYLILVSGCVSVGKLHTSEIFRITDTIFISLRNNGSDLERIQEVRRILNSGTFYFSVTLAADSDEPPYDLTLCAQRSNRTHETDNRFFWNRMLYLHPLRYGVNTNKWFIKAMCGGLCISTVYVGHLQAKACLISRLSCERVGTRFNVRGTNDSGHVANFVETEQFIVLDDKITSYIMTRGSIPLFWEQTGMQVGAHKVRMSRGSEVSQPAYDRHLASIKHRYGNQVLINLISNKEGEALIGKMFKAHHKSSRFSKDVPYIAFDYHHYCSHGKTDNIKILRDQIIKYLKDFSFFYKEKGVVQSQQSGTFRVNCIDCLDRTNRVQTCIGLEILGQQLEALGLTEKANIVSRFDEVFKNMWIQNGDQVSKIYAGTGALEGKSKLKDGTLSVARTIQNNLLDNSKQEAIDILLTGKPLNNEYSDRARSLLATHYLHLPSNILIAMCNKYLEFTEPISIKVSVGTWNVNGGKHFNSIIFRRSDPLSDWLLDNKKKNNYQNVMDMSLNLSFNTIEDNEFSASDIFAIGFQEIVDLNASNIMAASTTNQREWLVELQKTISRDEPYVLITSVQLVGVCLFLFARPKYASNIRDVAIDQVKTGLGGAAGNKGGVAIRLLFYNTSLCFVCSHFAAGQNQFVERNADYSEITRKASFPMGRSLNSHDYVFWCGDFNYRIDLSNEEVKRLVQDRQWSNLLVSDQLKCQQNDGKVFRNYIEGEIGFAPTYKYDINSDDYDTSEKCRVPAYTDRILFKKRFPTGSDEDIGSLNYGKILHYGRAELKTSDHRPVIAEFLSDILVVDENKRSQVFRNVLEQLGPLDATVVVTPNDFEDDDSANYFDDVFVTNILKRLANEAGEIILARFSEDNLRVTFREGQCALKAAKLGSISIFNKTFGVELKTKNWIDAVEEELKLGINNTIPLIDKMSDINDFQDNDHSLGPTFDASNFILEDDGDMGSVSSGNSSPIPPIESNEFNDKPPPLPGRSTPTAPPPARPPPPKNALASPSKSTSYKPTKPIESQQIESTTIINNKPLRPVPIRPAPLPPHKTSDNESVDLTHNQSFDLPPPSMPAPSLPTNDSDFDNNVISCPPKEYPPPPPPRVDSFQDNVEEPPLSPVLLGLPLAPPIPQTIEEPPPIPLRPNSATNMESANESGVQTNPPPIPARTITKPPIIPPRRLAQ
ncbi:synaptojanin-1-like [Oppia nitens]|uniref:synaptojanin-1-like n=1 Tax=Oppia nitens TaxID=1686743 RepID=UPI0023D9C75C|nr:synaptojanin-1-like [Oppia nitens]